MISNIISNIFSNNLIWKNTRPIVFGLFLLGLWLTLFLSLQSGDIRNLAHPGLNYTFLQGFRAALPLIAAFVAVVILVMKIYRQGPDPTLLMGPLGLMAAYGVVGVIASTHSPKGLDSLYWSVSYLSVPLVLWVIVWRPNAMEWISRLIILNWLIIVLAVAALFAIGLIYLTLGSFLISPSRWLDCSSQQWFDQTNHFIRDTGVGRYAALTGIIALSRMWHPKWRYLWALVFLFSMMLLLYSGARTAMVGFGVAAPVIVLLSGGKKTALASVVVGVALIPVFWATGIHSDFFGNCIFRTDQWTSAPVTAPATANPDGGPGISSVGGPGISSVGGPGISTNGGPGISSNGGPGISSNGGPGISSNGGPGISSNGGTNTGSNAEPETAIIESLEIPVIGIIPNQFFKFSGRTKVWKESLGMFSESPFLGYGFHADRFLLNTHAHNSFVQSLLQTGAIGTIPFLLGLLLAWFLLIRAGLKQFLFSQDQKSLFIQVSGMLAFLSVRSITESTGAFFGVDWFLLGPILLFLQVVNSDVTGTNSTSQQIGEHNSDKRIFS